MHTHLWLYIQHGHPPSLDDSLDGSEAGAIVVSAQLPILQEPLLLHLLLKLLLRCKIVVVAVDLPWANGAGGAWGSKGVCGECEGGKIKVL